jgi:hypothetical protein
MRRVCPSTLVLWLWLAALPASGQVVRLPAVEPPSQLYPGELLSHPDSSAEILQVPPPNSGAELLVTPEEELIEPPDPDRPPDARDGMFQKLIFTYTWLASGGADGLGINDVELKTVLALPIPSRKWPLIVTPGFGVHYLDGTRVPDLPARLYDAYVQFRSFRRFSPRWAMDLSVTPGVYSDFEQSTDDALRITGHGAAIFDWTPTTRLVFGVAYLDRDDLRVLPVGGLIWKPNPDVEFNLVAPRPSIAHRLYWEGASTDEIQDWVYIAGEYGGGTWAIQRADGSNDRVTYGDYRAILGLERRHIGGLDAQLEIGYVFGRSLEYRSGAEFDPTDTVMLRGGLTY